MQAPRGRDLALVILTASLASTTISLAVPLLSLVLDRAGYSPFTIGLNTAAVALGSLLVAPFSERIRRRLGAIACMRLCLLVVSGSLLMLPLLIDLVWWTVWRLLMGGAFALLFILSEAAINAMAPPERRGRIIALYATAFSVGFAAGPLLLAVTGSEGMLPFVVAAAFLGLAALPLGLVGDLDARLGQGEDEPPMRLHQVARAVPLPFAGVLVYAVLETCMFALLPVYALAQGLPDTRAGVLLSLWIGGNIIFQIPIGWLADRIGLRPMLAICAGVALVSLLLLPVSLSQPAFAWLLLPAGGSMGALYTLSLTMLGQRFVAGQLTQANAAFVVTFQLGLLVGPASAGGAMALFGPDALAVTLLLPVAALLVASLVRPASLVPDPGRP